MTDTDIGREDEAPEVYKGAVLKLYRAERLYTMGPDKRGYRLLEIPRVDPKAS